MSEPLWDPFNGIPRKVNQFIDTLGRRWCILDPFEIVQESLQWAVDPNILNSKIKLPLGLFQIPKDELRRAQIKARPVVERIMYPASERILSQNARNTV